MDTRRLHGLAQVQRAGHIVLVIGKWLLHALPNGLQAGKVNHGRDVPLSEQRIETGPVANIPLHKGQFAPRQPFHSPERFPRSVAEVIQHHHLILGFEQRQHRMGTDITSPAGHQNRHGTELLPFQ
ncbi:hypothetical protein Q427_15460 [Halomonas sp. BC04]|nr:hypothetical protein Q427_15460 [Halomonas sp. BC04]